MNRKIMITLLALASASCVGSERRSCEERGGIRKNGLCECPPGARQEGDECLAPSEPEGDDREPEDGGDELSDAASPGSDPEASPVRPDSPRDPRSRDAATSDATTSDAAISDAATSDGSAPPPATVPDAAAPPSPPPPAGDAGASPAAPDAGTSEAGKSDAGASDASIKPPACTPKAWYHDCDGDGYAESARIMVSACDAPAPTTGCRAWTSRAPGGKDATDCDDGNASRNPGATFGLSPKNASGDLNCDGKTERRYEIVDPLDPFAHVGMVIAPSLFCTEETLLCGCYQASALLSGYTGLVNGVPRFADSAPYYSHRILTVPPPCASIDSDAMMVEYVAPSTSCADSTSIPVAIVRNLCR